MIEKILILFKFNQYSWIKSKIYNYYIFNLLLLYNNIYMMFDYC